jgi:hypothetical protein
MRALRLLLEPDLLACALLANKRPGPLLTTPLLKRGYGFLGCQDRLISPAAIDSTTTRKVGLSRARKTKMDQTFRYFVTVGLYWSR